MSFSDISNAIFDKWSDSGKETIEHKEKTMTYDVRNPSSGLGQAQQCGGMKEMHGIPPPHPLDLDNLICNNCCSSDNVRNASK